MKHVQGGLGSTGEEGAHSHRLVLALLQRAHALLPACR